MEGFGRRTMAERKGMFRACDDCRADSAAARPSVCRSDGPTENLHRLGQGRNLERDDQHIRWRKRDRREWSSVRQVREPNRQRGGVAKTEIELKNDSRR